MLFQKSEMLPPPPAILQFSAGPHRRARKTTSREIEATMHLVPPLVLRDVNSGKSLNKAIQDQSSRVTWITFFKYRSLPYRDEDCEHRPYYEYIRQQHSRNSTKLLEECRSCLTDEDSPYFQHAQQKREDKDILLIAS
jgi:hypothetical protein